MSIYIFSTLSSDMAYTNYEGGGADMPIELPPVHIKGGANVADGRIDTPQGVMTKVTEQQLEYLRANPVFRMHEKNGFIVVSQEAAPIEKVVGDMEGRDNSAPVTPMDLPADSQPVTANGEEAPRRRRK